MAVAFASCKIDGFSFYLVALTKSFPKALGNWTTGTIRSLGHHHLPY
jgi:hypothetical protein